MAFLELKNVKKTYGSVVALGGVDLSVEAGEIRALLGGNGSGKSTIAKIVGGIVGMDSGKILIDDSAIMVTSPANAISQGIGVTSQELSLFPLLTVAENLSLINTPKKMGIFRDKKEWRTKAVKALARVGSEHLMDKKVAELTDSEKYLVELAKALVYTPRILIMDEVTSALRREEVKLVGEIMRELSAEGCTILFITHRMNEIFEFCSTVTVLKNGEIVNTYNVKDVDESTLLSDMIGENVKSESKMERDETGSEEIIFEVKNISLPGFEGNTVDLTLRKGQTIGIAGLQGQGQSQLLRTLFGMNEEISVKIDGAEKRITNPSSAIKAGIAFLSGDRVYEGAFLGRTISANLKVVSNLIMKKDIKDPDTVLKRYGVKYGSVGHPIESLSGGNQQKVIIARWMYTNPKVLLADDPTKGIDVEARKDVHFLINDMTNKYAGVIFASSDDEELVAMASRIGNYSVLVMSDGKFVKELKGDEISTANIISASVSGKEE